MPPVLAILLLLLEPVALLAQLANDALQNCVDHQDQRAHRAARRAGGSIGKTIADAATRQPAVSFVAAAAAAPQFRRPPCRPPRRPLLLPRPYSSRSRSRPRASDVKGRQPV